MKVTITLEHWNKAKERDALTAHKPTRVGYCPIAQSLKEMGLKDVRVDGNSQLGYTAHYCGTFGKVTGCGAKVAKTFDFESELPADLLPCTFELPDVPTEVSAS